MFEPLREYTLSMLADPEVEVNNSFPGQTDLKAVFVHVRNAVSHPRTNVTNPPTTGYTTIEDGTGYISRLCFTDSPDLNSRGALTPGALAPPDGDVPLPRVFSIELPLPVLTAWVEKLAETLAQPALNNWDSPELVTVGPPQ